MDCRLSYAQAFLRFMFIVHSNGAVRNTSIFLVFGFLLIGF